MSKDFKKDNRSSLHRKVYDLLREEFPAYKISENLPISAINNGKNTNLFIDIVVDELRVCIECNGIQHYKYNPHFHREQGAFEQGQRLDQEKKQIILDSGWAYLVIRYDEEKSLTGKTLMRRVLKALESNGKEADRRK